MASTTTETTVKASDLTANLTLDVRISGTKALLWRLKLAMWLIELAAHVAGTGVTIEGEVLPKRSSQ